MARAFTISSPRGGVAFVNPRTSQIVRYSPSAAYHRMKQRMLAIPSGSPSTIYLDRLFCDLYSREVAIPAMLTAAMNQVKVVYVNSRDLSFKHRHHIKWTNSIS